jgi:hypothetical protein
VWTSPALQCEAGREYAASVWITVEQGLAAVKLDFQDADGNWLESSLPVKVTGPRGWTQVVVAARAADVPGAEGATQVSLALAVEGEGTVWFDDVQFGPIGGEAGHAEDAGNLLRNGSFGQGGAEIIPGWSLRCEPPMAFTARVVDDGPPDGGRCVELSGEGDYALLSSEAIACDAGATYQATAQATASGSRFRAFLKIDHLRRERLLGRVQSEHIETEGDWAELTVTSGPDDHNGADHIRAVLVLQGRGTARFSGVVLQRADP